MNPIQFILNQRLMIKIILFVFAMLMLGMAFGQTTTPTLLSFDSTEMVAVNDTATTAVMDTAVALPDMGIEIPNPRPLFSIDIPGLIMWEQFIYHVLLLLFAWFSYAFPKLKQKNIKFRTAAIGITLIAVFVGFRYYSDATFSIGSVLSYLINFLVTTQAYDKIYSELFGKSPKPQII